jgi:hypothetical protein
LNANVPALFSEAAVNEGLARLLLPAEAALLKRPFAVREELARWAREATASADDPLARDRALFAAIVKRAPFRRAGDRRNAQEVFEERIVRRAIASIEARIGR